MKHRPQDRQYLLVALVVLGLSSAIVEHVPGVKPLTEAAGRALTPVQSALTQATARIHAILGGTRDLEMLNAEILRLEDENARLKTDNLRLTSLQREVRDLRALMDFQNARPDLDLMGTSIVGGVAGWEPGHLTRSVKLDVGASQGVRLRMTVANHRGLIGQVVRVSDHWTDVLLITDPTSAVSARIDRSREAGMVFGSPNGDLVMRYVPQNQADMPPKIQVGDLVFTSGQSQRFPPQILIGQVVEVRQDDYDTFQEAVIRPSVDFNALETAMLITAWTAPLDAADAAADPAGAGQPDVAAPPPAGDDGSGGG